MEKIDGQSGEACQLVTLDRLNDGSASRERVSGTRHGNSGGSAPVWIVVSSGLWWAAQDLNLRPAEYEAALIRENQKSCGALGRGFC